jgi:mobilization protein NikA
MSKRLQVVLGEEEFDELRQMAKEHGLTVSEWVRQTLRRARADRPSGDRSRKLAAVRAASRHSFPAPPIEQMLDEIKRGYLEG